MDVEEKMRQAARGMAPVRLSSFSFASSSVSRFELMPEGHDPVGVFTDAVRYSGTVSEGASISYVTAWISPVAGQIRQVSSHGGLLIVTQREELAPPGEFHTGGLFEWTLRILPPQPFLAWRNVIRVQGLMPGLTETAHQKRVGDGEYLLSRAAEPSDEDLRQPPARASAGIGPEDAPYLEDSPLLGFRGPEIASLASRLAPNPSASRWELSCLINSFVFGFIRDKALDVGFASAPEVALAPRGDCTEHTVLAIALLRRAGVPARAAWGWAGLDDGSEATLGLHTWAEVKIGGRWIPIDPTFDQAPAGAFRIALGNSALNSLAEFGRGLVFPSAAALKTIAAPFVMYDKRLIVDDAEIAVSRGRWALYGDRLFLEHPQFGQISVSGNIRTLPKPDAKFIHVAGKSPARYTKSLAQLAIDSGKNRWLYLDGLNEANAAAMLGELKIGGSG
jgi:transglutaminase-like putative cysteine protease